MMIMIASGYLLLSDPSKSNLAKIIPTALKESPPSGNLADGGSIDHNDHVMSQDHLHQSHQHGFDQNHQMAKKDLTTFVPQLIEKLGEYVPEYDKSPEDGSSCAWD